MRTILTALLMSVGMSAAAAVITVNGTGDATAIDGACTLREAIVAANTNTGTADCTAGQAGLDTIAFNIGGGGVQTITPASNYLPLTEPVIIDGTTQPGYAGTPLIVINGLPREEGSYGFALDPTATGSTIRGLAIGGFSYGLYVRSSGNVITRNYFGVDASGTTTIPNSLSIYLHGPLAENVIGGATPADQNVIAAGTSTAVFLFLADNNTIRNNAVGLDAAGNVIGTGSGIGLQTSSGNVIEDNQMFGMAGGVSAGFASNGNIIRRNVIGREGAGNFNGGITISESNDNVIGGAVSGDAANGNVIAYNGQNGVRIFSGINNSIFANSIHDNAELGIDLPAGSNDDCDSDGGGNYQQNYPLLRAAVRSGATTIIRGELESLPSQKFTLEFFSNPDGVNAEAQTYIGNAVVETNAGCDASFIVTLPVAVPLGEWITATASYGRNTSEVSPQAVAVQPELIVTKSFAPSTIVRNGTSQLTITIHNPSAVAASEPAFTDTYPAGLVNVGGATFDCGGGAVADAGSNFLSYAGRSIAAGGTCTITATVTAPTAGTYENVLPAGAATTFGGQFNAAPASATLVVRELAPIVTKTFTPHYLRPGEPNVLTIALRNPNPTALTNVAFTDVYPAGMVNVDPLERLWTCGGNVIASSGGNTLELIGGTIAPMSTCTVRVSVTTSGPGPFVNTLPAGAVTSANAAPSAAATATLAALQTIPTLSTWMMIALAALLVTVAARRM